MKCRPVNESWYTTLSSCDRDILLPCNQLSMRKQPMDAYYYHSVFRFARTLSYGADIDREDKGDNLVPIDR